MNVGGGGETANAIGSKPIALRGLWVRLPPAAFTRPVEDVARVRRLASYGLNHSQICRLTGGTISSLTKKRCFKLRVFMDRRYPRIIAEVVEAMRAVMPTSIAAVQPHPRHNAVEIHSYSNAWPCLFPQHGPGRKHERKIELTPWQEAIVDREPEKFIRGLIHSDGCRTTNRVTVAASGTPTLGTSSPRCRRTSRGSSAEASGS